jgi:protein-S-isoprenylcysteine O-methyltransferase Ste14
VIFALSFPACLELLTQTYARSAGCYELSATPGAKRAFVRPRHLRRIIFHGVYFRRECRSAGRHAGAHSMIWHYLIEGPWIVLVIYWWSSALKARRTVHRESFASRYGILFMLFAGYVLVFVHSEKYDVDAKVGLFGQPILPRSDALAVAAVVFTWTGIGLALWARSHLGQYWSARVAVKEDHKLVRTGPYAYFRHPIYSGFDLAMIGGALAVDRWRCVIGVVLVIVAYWIKAKKEESMLTEQFGPAFQ